LARLDLGHPVLDATFALTHTYFERLLRDRLVREHADPDFATTLDVTGHGTTSRFDLTRGQATTTGGLQTNGAKRHLAATLCQTAVAALELLTKLGALRL